MSSQATLWYSGWQLHFQLQLHTHHGLTSLLVSGQFVGGCGRFFEGSPDDMVRSMAALATLPPATKVYCGHEVPNTPILPIPPIPGQAG